MGQTLLAATASGLALAGVLAVAGAAAARFGRDMPHLGIGAVGAAAAVGVGRLNGWPIAASALVMILAAGLLGVAAWAVDRQVRASVGPVWPPPLLADVVVLGLAIGVAGLLRTATAIELPLGPMGGLATTPAAAVAGVIGVAFGVAVLLPAVVKRGEALGWALAAIGTAVAIAVGSGGLVLGGQVLMPAFGVPDILGLAIRAAAVGVLARRGVVWAVGAALAFGLFEAALRAWLSSGEAAIVPALLVLAWALSRPDQRTVAPAAS